MIVYGSLAEELTKEDILKGIEKVEIEKLKLSSASKFLFIVDNVKYPFLEIIRISGEIKFEGNIPQMSVPKETVEAIRYVKELGFKIREKPKKNDPVATLIHKYKIKIQKTKLEDELYKWQLIDEFKGRPNLKADDFYQEIKSIKFQNLVYAMGIAVLHHLAKDANEELRVLFKNLFDENTPISKRVIDFKESSLELYRATGGTLQHHQDERSIATYLTLHNPKKYALYKNSFYRKYCQLIKLKPVSTGYKYVHYLELLQDFIDDYIIDDIELIEMVRGFVPLYDGRNHLLLAQDILYQTLEIIDKEKIKDSDILLNGYKEYLIDDKLGISKATKDWYYNEANVEVNFRWNDCYKEKFDNFCFTSVDFAKLKALLIINYKGKRTFKGITSFIDYLNVLMSDMDIQINKGEKNNSKFELNQILYGPPGTGKTFHTINNAISIIENKDLEEINRESRSDLLERYKGYVLSKQIVFTTFHQSMSYEDFIEGIKPVTNSTGDLTYEVEDGIFKEICTKAKGVKTKNNLTEKIDFSNTSYFKMSLGGKNRKDIHDWCIENNQIALGWGRNNDFSMLNGVKSWGKFKDKFNDQFPDLIEESKFNAQAVYAFQNWMEIGDIVIVSLGNKIIDAIGIVEGDYEYVEESKYNYHHIRKVKWLSTNMDASPKLFVDKNISQQSIYKFDSDDIIINSFQKFNATNESGLEEKPHVIIIDEINRGNVSAIFGEMITLLEDDKRRYNKEELELILPYSKEPFSVPNNVYVVGTMNTADRSVEALDTALRRRFSFVEMLPDATVLQKEHINKGFIEYDNHEIDLSNILTTINKRIEVLVDRDHTIGHAYFMDVISIEDLKNAFQNKIIPLLQEYFYGDYKKLEMVIGTNFFEKNKNKDVEFAVKPNDFDVEGESYRILNVSQFTEEEMYQSIVALKPVKMKDATTELAEKAINSPS